MKLYGRPIMLLLAACLLSACTQREERQHIESEATGFTASYAQCVLGLLRESQLSEVPGSGKLSSLGEYSTQARDVTVNLRKAKYLTEPATYVLSGASKEYTLSVTYTVTSKDHELSGSTITCEVKLHFDAAKNICSQDNVQCSWPE